MYIFIDRFAAECFINSKRTITNEFVGQVGLVLWQKEDVNETSTINGQKWTIIFIALILRKFRNMTCV